MPDIGSTCATDKIHAFCKLDEKWCNGYKKNVYYMYVYKGTLDGDHAPKIPCSHVSLSVPASSL